MDVLIRAWGDARRKVMNAQTRAQFHHASADLWDAEQALLEAYNRLTVEPSDG